MYSRPPNRSRIRGAEHVERVRVADADELRRRRGRATRRGRRPGGSRGPLEARVAPRPPASRARRRARRRRRRSARSPRPRPPRSPRARARPRSARAAASARRRRRRPRPGSRSTGSARPGRLEHAAQRLHHPAGDDDHAQARVARAGERGQRPRPQHVVLPDQRVVEVGRDDVDVAREAVREARSAAGPLPGRRRPRRPRSASSVSWPLNGGIAPLPFDDAVDGEREVGLRLVEVRADVPVAPASRERVAGAAAVRGEDGLAGGRRRRSRTRGGTRRLSASARHLPDHGVRRRAS